MYFTLIDLSGGRLMYAVLCHAVFIMTMPQTSAVVGAPASDVWTGNGSWLGAGLLGLVLSWLLMKHLPEKDKQIKDLLDSQRQQLDNKDIVHRNHIKEIIETHAKIQADLRADHKEALDTVVSHCEKETTSVTAALRTQIEYLSATLLDMKNSAVTQATKKT